MGFPPVDAYHIASAELLNADCFLTIDNRLLTLARQREKKLNTKVLSPVTFIQELPDEKSRCRDDDTVRDS